MKKNELEFRNLEQIRQLLDEDKRFEACTMLLALGNLLIQCKDNSMQPVMLLGQYSKICKQLLALYNTLMKTFSPENELKQYELRLQNIKCDLQQVQKQYSTLKTASAELLQQEKGLRDQKKQLKELVAQTEELTNLKENEIKELENKSKLLKEQLEQLEKETEIAKYSLERYQSELSEDGRLIRNLPNRYGTTQSVDSLIARLKEEENQAQDLHDSYEQGLIDLMEQIRISYENLKGGSHE